MDEAHATKREAIEKFIHHEGGGKDWIIRVHGEDHEERVRVGAHRDDEGGTAEAKSLEIHTPEIHMEDGELDEATKTLIRRWVASLN